jgi:uncharacterized RDD family membrane protein YckC
MAHSPNPSALIQPLSIGNVVSVGVELYKGHLKSYLGVATVAVLWAIFPFVALVPIIFLFVSRSSDTTLLFLLIPIWFVFFLYCFARFLAASALISRLAFTELIGQPDSIRTARSYTESRKWSFLLAAFFLFLIFLGIFIPLYLVAAIVIAGIVGVMVTTLETPSGDNWAAIGTVGIFSLIIASLLILAFVWLFSRFAITEVPLAIENDMTASGTIARTWELTQRNALRIFLMSVVAFLITIPVQVVIQFGVAIIQQVFSIFVSSDSPAAFSFSTLLGYILGLLGSILLIPFWQSIRAIIYYDLRSRREGFGLQLRDRPSSSSTRFFKQVTLQTPESVELEFRLAGIGNRAFALLIDYHVLALLLVGFLALWALFSNQLLNYLEQLEINYTGVPNWLWAIALLVTFTIFVSYFLFFETLWQGQTPGKRVVGLRVIRDDGRPARVGQATLRALLRPFDDFLFVGVFFLILGKREKRLGDWVAGTLVIQESRSIAKAPLVLAEQAQTITKQLLEMANISLLLPDDFAVIREYLQRRSLMESRAKTDFSLNLARQVKDAIALEKLPEDMTPDVFLEAVYLAYQQQDE